MRELERVSRTQLMAYWKSFAVSMLILVGIMILSKVLPTYFSPVIGLIGAAMLYTMLYNNRLRKDTTCMITPYAIFYCVIEYSFVSIILNVLDIWDIAHIPKELSFFNEPYFIVLLIDPICFLVMLVFVFRRKRLAICVNCKLEKGISLERGRLGEILDRESRVQMYNLLWMFAFLSVLTWVYYFNVYYTSTAANNRDVFILVWGNVIAFALDGIYFASRYYNIYLDLQESGDIISEDELMDMTTRTYIRFYVICGNHIYVDTNVADTSGSGKLLMDTPFVTKRNVSGILPDEVRGIIRQLTGQDDGELRFIFGRKNPEVGNSRMLRYFYFLNCPEDNLPVLKLRGEWMDFSMLKVLYNTVPGNISKSMLGDISRITTIVLTQKIFDDRGIRKMKIKSYKPTYDLLELREKRYDFQDDKWLKISMYNSDSRGFYVKRWWRKLWGLRENREWESRP